MILNVMLLRYRGVMKKKKNRSEIGALQHGHGHAFAREDYSSTAS